jgi:hypothetical protein
MTKEKYNKYKRLSKEFRKEERKNPAGHVCLMMVGCGTVIGSVVATPILATAAVVKIVNKKKKAKLEAAAQAQASAVQEQTTTPAIQ